jgi:hypothetical protein
MFAPWGGTSGQPLTGCVSYSTDSGCISMDASLCACFDVLAEGVGLWAISPFHNASSQFPVPEGQLPSSSLPQHPNPWSSSESP